MFHKVPVVINSFNLELRQGIDYISTKQGLQGQTLYSANVVDEVAITRGQPQSWAPTLSNISVLITPIYSRESVKRFSLSDFARGRLNGKGTGEIGFI